MAASLSMGYETFRDWLVRHPELREVVQIEKAVADQRVVESLFLRATGYTRQAQRPLIDRAGRPVVVICPRSMRYRRHDFRLRLAP